MMKFKKFLAAAMTGAMVLGTVAMAVPAMSVYAVEEEGSQTPAQEIRKLVSIGKVVYPLVATKGYNGYCEVVNPSFDEGSGQTEEITWKLSGNSSANTTITPVSEPGKWKAELTVDEEETAKILTIEVTGKTTTSVKATFEVLVGTGVGLKIDYDSMVGTLETNGNDSFLFLEVLKDEKGTKPGTTYCYEVDNDHVEVDLSFLKLSKDAYVRVFGDKNATPLKESYTIGKQPKKPSVKYVAGKTDIKDSFTIKNGKLEELEYKGLYEEGWSDLSKLSKEELDKLAVTGTTLLVRQSATETAPPSSETKVKIAASPKAPKVTLDYAKNTIKLPKDCVIQVPAATMVITGSAIEDDILGNFSFSYKVGSGKEDLTVAPMALAEKLVAEYITQYNAAPEYKEEPLPATAKDDLLESMKDGYSILVRTNNKKGTSQPAFVEVKAAPKLVSVSGSAIGAGTIAVLTVKDGQEAPSTTDTVSFKYEDKGLTLTPNGSLSYAYSVDGGKKFSKLKKATTIAYKKIDATNKVVVRVEGTKEDTKNKKPGSWASNAVVIPVSPAKVVITGDTSIANTTSGVSKSYTVSVKDDLGNDVSVTGKTFTWAATGSGVTISNGSLSVPAAYSGEITITVTSTNFPGLKGELKVNVTAAPAATTTP